MIQLRRTGTEAVSRSYQHTSICSWCSVKAGTQKQFRSKENRAKRKKVKQILNSNSKSDLPNEKEYGNEWASPRDGKQWFGRLQDKNYYKKLMRK